MGNEKDPDFTTVGALTCDEFQERVSGSDKPIMVVFTADWSGSCHMIDPILEKLDDEVKGKNRILKIDSDQNKEIVEKYNIQSFPTFLFFENGEIYDSITGITSPKEISKKLIVLRRKSEKTDQ